MSGSEAAALRIGDSVYMRHAKAGELCERFDSLYLVQGGEIVDEVPTYRGEGQDVPLSRDRFTTGRVACQHDRC